MLDKNYRTKKLPEIVPRDWKKTISKERSGNFCQKVANKKDVKNTVENSFSKKYRVVSIANKVPQKFIVQKHQQKRTWTKTNTGTSPRMYPKELMCKTPQKHRFRKGP